MNNKQELKQQKEDFEWEQLETGGSAKEEGKESSMDMITEMGSAVMGRKEEIYLLTIIGEIEGHDNLSSSAKTTKYEHILPKLAAIEDDPDIYGVLVLLNTMGGDVEAGLSIAEMLASLSKPTVSLVLGGSHSIGVPIAVSTDYSFIVPTGTMVIHPVRTNGMVLGVAQTFDYFKQIQDRITGFISTHSRISKEELERMMLETGILTKDMGTILVGEQAVRRGIIDEVGGISQAVRKLRHLIDDEIQKK